MLLFFRYGHSDLVTLLLQRNCDLSHCNKSNRSALHAAAENDQGNVVLQLLGKGMDPSVKDNMGKTALSLAAQLGHFHVLSPLTETDHDIINEPDLYSMTPLHWAVVGGHKRCVELLLSVGANANVQNGGVGNTPLMLAIDSGHADIVRLLLQSNCNVNAVNNQEHSALHEAAARGATGLIELLLPAGAYVDMQTSKGDTAMMIATRRGYANVVRLLLDVNCSVETINSKHVTALHEAALWGSCDVAKMLISHGAPVDLPEQDGDTPLTLAAMKGRISTWPLIPRNIFSTEPLTISNCDFGKIYGHSLPKHWCTHRFHYLLKRKLTATNKIWG